MPSDEGELTKEEALERLAYADRQLDRGGSPPWGDMLWIVAAARQAVEHGYTPVVDGHTGEAWAR